MSYKHNIIKERYDLEITTAGEVTKGRFELDHNVGELYGVALTTDSEEHLYYRGSQKMQLNDSELFPEGFESRLLMSGLNVSPNQRMVKVGAIQRGNGLVEIWYKDTDHPKASFAPYRVTFYFFSKSV